jgi:hypothetical protein
MGAKQEKKKGRAAGGIIAGVKLGIKEKRRRMYGKKRTYRQRMVENNDNKEMKRTIRGVENTIKENREDCMLLGRDFNRRTGEREGRNWEQERRDGKRKSKDKDKDKVENAKGKRLMEWNEENGWKVLNGDKQGDEEGEGVIDYGRVNDEAWERVEEFRIGERVESNHLPLEIYTYRRNEP